MADELIIVRATSAGHFALDANGQPTYLPIVGPGSVYEDQRGPNFSFSEETIDNNRWINDSAISTYKATLTGVRRHEIFGTDWDGALTCLQRYAVGAISIERKGSIGSINVIASSIEMPILRGGNEVRSSADHSLDITIDMLSSHLNKYTLSFIGSEVDDWFAATVGRAATIKGLGGNDHLDGGSYGDTIYGGTGADVMAGWDGDDTYSVDNVHDIAKEGPGQGNDTVNSSVTYSIRHYEIETLNLIGKANINAVGNANANTLNGNVGDNVLNGGGGDDIMAGGRGNDRYIVDSEGDRVFEVAGGGTADRISTSVNFAMTAAHHVEQLFALDPLAETNLRLTGNAFNQIIRGNAGDNILNGAGGADQLTGSDGEDTFYFTSTPGPGNVDTITDFDPFFDTIQLQDNVFSALDGPGFLPARHFRQNTSGRAEDQNDHIIHETDTGRIFYDPDGTGAASAVLFARITPELTLTHRDFYLV